jgi:16S rRNA (adenine1518-N6/adenine1519-N6)-dimethyltransferase
VDSAIILFTPRKETIFDPETRRQFFKLLDAAFSQRRKIILNSLMSAMGGKISKDRVGMCLGEAGIDPCSRAERVPFEQFLALFKAMQKRGWHW